MKKLLMSQVWLKRYYVILYETFHMEKESVENMQIIYNILYCVHHSLYIPECF